jgi:type VI secretion system protein ImpI
MGDFAPKAEPAAPVVPPAAPPAAAAFAAPAATALPAELEQILHIVADGVMDVLRARAEIKNTFRLPVTIIQRSENNPLKFAPTADEAVQRILAPTGPAFLSGSAAFQDAFEDIRCHQMAMLAGVRAAFESLLVHFNPDRFEHEADGGAKRAAFGGKGRYWDRYREHFEELMGNPDECFRRLFGDEFARAYEEQLARLKSVRRAEQARRP